MGKKYVNDENCLIEWEGNGLDCVSTTAIQGMIEDLDRELASRGEAFSGRDSLHAVMEASRLRQTLERIATDHNLSRAQCAELAAEATSTE